MQWGLREFFLLQDAEKPLENQAFEERSESGYTGLSGNDLWYVEVKTRECVIRFINRVGVIDKRPIRVFQSRPKC